MMMPSSQGAYSHQHAHSNTQPATRTHSYNPAPRSQHPQSWAAAHSHAQSPPRTVMAPSHPTWTAPQPPLESSEERAVRIMEERTDVVMTMRRQETKYYGTDSSGVEGNSWRPVMIQWMYSVVDLFNLVPQVVPTAMYYLDRAMPILMQTASDYQLLGLTCLELAIKTHDTKLFPLDELVRIGQGGFLPAQVVEMEAKLVQSLQWNLHPPTPHCFVHQFVQILKDDPQVPLATCKSIANRALSLVRHALWMQVPQKPSILAYAALLASMEQNPSLPTSVKQALCLQMLPISGLSATTPGLAEAYQVLAEASRPTRDIPSVVPVSRPVSPATPVVESYPVSPCSFGTAPMASTTLASPKVPASVTIVRPERRKLPDPTIIFSAGHELGFEVTLCPSADAEDSDAEDEEVAAAVLGAGLSPRNISGAVSPDRLEAAAKNL